MTNTPLSGSVKGRPITISDSVVTTVHTSKPTRTDNLTLSILNTTGGAIVVTIDVGAVTAAFSLGANAIEQIEMSVADGEVLGMQGAAVGLRVIGTADQSSNKIA